jgi:hypothetical protein
MNLDSTIHADPTVGRSLAVPTSFAFQVPSVDQSDRKVPINLRQSGPTPWKARWWKFPSGHRPIQAPASGQKRKAGILPIRRPDPRK